MKTEQPATKSKFKRSLPVLFFVCIVGLIVLGILLKPLFSGDSPLQKTDASAATNAPIKVDLYQASVSITSRSLSPATVTIKQGDSVAWFNKDRTMHLIVSDSGLAGFKGQGDLLFSDLYLYTFTTVGTYSYHDQFNPSLRGTIVVE